jgi:hypothetical protein
VGEIPDTCECLRLIGWHWVELMGIKQQQLLTSEVEEGGGLGFTVLDI